MQAWRSPEAACRHPAAAWPPPLLTSSLDMTLRWYMRSKMKRFFSQCRRWIFHVSSDLRLPSCSSFTASLICCSKSSITWWGRGARAGSRRGRLCGRGALHGVRAPCRVPARHGAQLPAPWQRGMGSWATPWAPAHLLNHLPAGWGLLVLELSPHGAHGCCRRAPLSTALGQAGCGGAGSRRDTFGESTSATFSVAKCFRERRLWQQPHKRHPRSLVQQP